MNPALKRALKIEVAMSLLGAIVGVGLVFIFTHISFFEPWEKIGALPNGPIVSLAENYPFVYATLSDNAIYECHLKTCTRADPASIPLPRVSNPYYFCGDPNAITPPPPGYVTASVSLKYCGIDTTVDIYVVGLDNGSLWQWHESTSPADMIVYPALFIPGGALAGAILGIPLNLIVYFVRRRTQGKAKRS